ncbi:MAG: ribulose-phosphate 3-epimerase [Alphaproteobacteria bacterium]|nr:ribulose-phosphate 3-epimerase [Alphaproteobacteria bacterium]
MVRGMVAIAPSLLAADMANLGDELRAVSPRADYIHLDVMDGHFVPNLSYGPAVIAGLRPLSDKPFDVHLMIENPEQWVAHYAEAGADIISVHWEATNHADRLLQSIKDLGKKAGIALNPATPVGVITDILDKIDMVVVMSVNPGFGGQKYISNANRKLQDLRKIIGTRDILLEVDGGVTAQTAPQAVQAGADILVAGSSIFANGDCKSDNYNEAIDALKIFQGE